MNENLSSIAAIQLPGLLSLAKEAGAGILSIYKAVIEVTLKEDRSPLTQADQISHNIIVKGLTALTPGIPIISEEGKDIPYETRRSWETYWCVDPLDGTKEFIKRNGEFTVNIALMSHNQPVFGIIYVPVTGELYYGGEGIGSWKEDAAGNKKQIYADKESEEWVAVGSKSHASADEGDLLKQYNVQSTTAIGSSLKFCLIAEGKAHIYYRQGPTMEWDTAAGQAIAVYSGAIMTDANGELFKYNKPSLLNGGFLVKVA
jgi:3'(2'), 5'-bisphosphate nucleotidase